MESSCGKFQFINFRVIKAWKTCKFLGIKFFIAK